MRRFGVFAAWGQGADPWPGRRQRCCTQWQTKAIANRDADPTRRLRQDQGAITSQKVVAQGDQVTRLYKMPRVIRLIQSSPDDIS
jgi:hypothetical protein